MTNVRPGDLAIVVGCPDIPFNGATCEVIGLGLEPHDLPRDLLFDGQRWLIRFGRPMSWPRRALGLAGGVFSRQGYFPDKWLRKIAGPAVLIEVKTADEAMA